MQRTSQRRRTGMSKRLTGIEKKRYVEIEDRDVFKGEGTTKK